MFVTFCLGCTIFIPSYPHTVSYSCSCSWPCFQFKKIMKKKNELKNDTKIGEQKLELKRIMRPTGLV